MLMMVAVIPKTTLMAISVVLDEAEEDMLTGQLVRDTRAEGDFAVWQEMERLEVGELLLRKPFCSENRPSYRETVVANCEEQQGLWYEGEVRIVLGKSCSL